MSAGCFVDTSAWYALVDADDTYYSLATRRFLRLVQQRRTLVTTNHIVAETYGMLRSRLGFESAQTFLQRVRVSPFTERVSVPESWEESAEDLLARYDDQDVSYVDAVSFVTMRRRGIQVAFTFDHHFVVAGFTLIEHEIGDEG